MYIYNVWQELCIKQVKLEIVSDRPTNRTTDGQTGSLGIFTFNYKLHR